VIAMGGGIDVHSRGVGQGATFTVSLPVAVELAAAS
jgi:signal transduction histidine kinase